MGNHLPYDRSPLVPVRPRGAHGDAGGPGDGAWPGLVRRAVDLVGSPRRPRPRGHGRPLSLRHRGGRALWRWHRLDPRAGFLDPSVLAPARRPPTAPDDWLRATCAISR